ncbi:MULTISPECIES: FKBP-type peptidyl-prolyl cis-trans isomerase [unclassified Phenylobacterium]|uniref:FKBP-type peptidyl-prolyl cis-trans isomerase n=1 Tax=unclassified Phenylobacterium TaxID=2640670 RepID=UPI0022B37C43|nr:FKBP-type peptidyl-prolyl cis-trans isomerase [Phenylobacterium sp. NIBR 498073]MBS0490043.1 FKBP-type peptidyl-prolyl cis-trans isomerase [Pseudomonadota bacterium]WGU39079.1 FKBP-type peptidyl-prolyl cis-trans isomerase [Phenylobacterium sp. NIBR 498073]
MKKLAGVLLALALAGPAAAQDANAEFFARNAQAPGVKTIPGIQYKVLKSGPETGVHPKRSSTIKVRYEGKFLDGRVFDSSKNDPDGAVTFPLGKLIPGWVTVLPLMRPGDEWVIYIPPEYAYGPAGKEIIPPNTPLEFRIELVEVVD